MNRRNFTRMTGLGAVALQAIPTAVSAKILLNDHPNQKSGIPLGVGNHSLRAMKPNAMQLIDFAIEQRLDSVQFNTLAPLESLDDKHLARVKKYADANDITIYIGVGSISELSDRYNDSFGDAKTLVKTGIRVAKALGSPVIGVRIGVMDDRYTEGGIQPKMDEVINLMRSFRDPVSDAGIKFAFENHAGDMRTEELLDLIEATGSDICGAFFDPGNATYALEDPKLAMERVGKHIVCCSTRDVMIWQTEDGAMFQWTAVGEGMMDYQHYTDFLRKNCPGVPLHLEIISNSPRSLPFLTDEFWKGYPDLRARQIIEFLKMARKGHPIEVAVPPPGMDKKTFETENQKDELIRSLDYLRDKYGVGLK